MEQVQASSSDYYRDKLNPLCWWWADGECYRSTLASEGEGAFRLLLIVQPCFLLGFNFNILNFSK